MRVPADPLGSYPFYLQPFFWNQRRKYGEVLQAALFTATCHRGPSSLGSTSCIASAVGASRKETPLLGGGAL